VNSVDTLGSPSTWLFSRIERCFRNYQNCLSASQDHLSRVARQLGPTQTIADEVVEPGRSSAIVALKLIANTRSRPRETIAAGDHTGPLRRRGWADNQSGADATVRQQLDSQASLLRPSFRNDEGHVVCYHSYFPTGSHEGIDASSPIAQGDLRWRSVGDEVVVSRAMAAVVSAAARFHRPCRGIGATDAYRFREI
jgi:hypothetical protein